MTDTPAVAALRVQLADPAAVIDRGTVTAVLAERDRLVLDLATDRGLARPFAPAPPQAEAHANMLRAQVWHLNPDCEQGKHQACAGDAWDDTADQRARCACLCHHQEAS